MGTKVTKKSEQQLPKLKRNGKANVTKPVAKSQKRRPKPRHDCFWRDCTLGLGLFALSIIVAIMLTIVSLLLK
jgi:hypothetical protein